MVAVLGSGAQECFDDQGTSPRDNLLICFRRNRRKHNILKHVHGRDPCRPPYGRVGITKLWLRRVSWEL
jgi:hypothetical protein